MQRGLALFRDIWGNVDWPLSEKLPWRKLQTFTRKVMGWGMARGVC